MKTGIPSKEKQIDHYKKEAMRISKELGETKEKLKTVEAERDDLKKKVHWFNQILSGNSKKLEEKLSTVEAEKYKWIEKSTNLASKLHALEKIAREGLENIKYCDEFSKKRCCNQILRKIDELIGGGNGRDS